MMRVLSLIALLALAGPAAGVDLPNIRYGAKVPPEVKMIYERGLNYLAANQLEDGSWSGRNQNGITGLALMVFLASGDDPNFGQYNVNVRKALRGVIRSQNARTGFIPDSMYHHGFAMLGLAEAYGAVDDSLLWSSGEQAGARSIGEALELAVRCSVTSQKKNAMGGWRYSPDSRDADTSVSGAVLVGLLAARNAGIEVPDEAVDTALEYYRQNTSSDGSVAYSRGSGGMSMNRSAIATLVFSVGKKKDLAEYQATLGYITSRIDQRQTSHPFYFRYYMAQALFQGDFDAWTKWNRENTRFLQDLQHDDGSFPASHGPAYGTSMSLLSLALNYRFLPIYER